MPILPKKNSTSKTSYDKHHNAHEDEEDEDEKYSERNMTFGDTSGKQELDALKRELARVNIELNVTKISLQRKESENTDLNKKKMQP